MCYGHCRGGENCWPKKAPMYMHKIKYAAEPLGLAVVTWLWRCRATTLTCNKLETGQVVTRSSGVQNGSLVQKACWAAGEDDPVWQWCIHRHSDGHRWCSCVDTRQAHAWTQMMQPCWQARMDTAMGTSPLGRTDEGSLCRVQYGWILGDPRDREMELILSYHENWVIPDPCHIL
jgi:hypothetical protein